MSEWKAQLKERAVELLGKYERDFIFFSTGFGLGIVGCWLL